MADSDNAAVDWSQFSKSGGEATPPAAPATSIDWSKFSRSDRPGAPQGALQNLQQGLEYGAGAAVHGVNQALGFIGDVETGGQAAADKYLPEGWSGRSAEQIKAGPAPHLFPTTEDYDRATDYLGLTGREWQKPQSSTQELVGKGISGGTSALLTLPFAPEVGAAKTFAQGAGGGLAAEASRQAGAPPLVQALAGAAGGGGTQLLQHLAAGDPVAKAAALLGGSTTFQTAGEHLQDAARVWKNEVYPREMDRAEAPVNALIGQNTPTPIDEFHQTLQNIVRSGGSISGITGQLEPGLAKRLLAATNERMADTVTPVEMPFEQRWHNELMGGAKAGFPTEIPPIVTPASPPSWGEAMTLKRLVGNAMGTPKLVEDIGQQNLNNLYRALSNDQRSTAAGISPDAAQAFDNYNDTAKGLIDHANGPISKIISDSNVTDDPKIGAQTAATRLLAGDPRNLAALARSMPTAVGQLASAFLHETPEKWGKLNQAMKDALIPNETLQVMLDKALPANPAKVGHVAAGGTMGAALGLAGGNQLLAPEIATVMSHALGSTVDPLVAASLGGLGMAGAGMVGGMARGLANNPAALLGPARGALASGTSNALVPSSEGPLASGLKP